MQVFREFYPKKEEATVMLECVWQTDKYVLVERTYESESNIQEKHGQGDVSLNASQIQYQSIEALLGGKATLKSFLLSSIFIYMISLLTI